METREIFQQVYDNEWMPRTEQAMNEFRKASHKILCDSFDKVLTVYAKDDSLSVVLQKLLKHELKTSIWSEEELSSKDDPAAARQRLRKAADDLIPKIGDFLKKERQRILSQSSQNSQSVVVVS